VIAIERVRAAMGRIRRDRRTPAAAVFTIAFLILTVAFWANEDNKGQPEAPRGKGEYLPVLARGDGHFLYLLCRSLVLDGDLILDNDLRDFGDPWRQPISKTGRKYTAHPIGPALIWAPSMVFADASAGLLNSIGAKIERHGYTEWHQRIVLFWSVIFGVGSTLLGYFLARRWLGGRWGPLYAAMAILFGTSLTYYATYMPAYGHAMHAFFSAVFLILWARGIGDLRWRRFALLGIALGVAALVRGQELALGIVVAIELAWLAVRPPPGAPSRLRFVPELAARGALALGVALVTFTPQMIAWHKITGDWWHEAHGPEYVRYAHPQITELLFASKNGWFSTTPLAYAGVIGLVLVPRRARFVALALGAALLIQVWLNSSILDWWSSASYGQRRLCSVTVILVFGLASLLRAAWALASKLRGRQLARLVAAHAIAALVLFWFCAWNWGWVSMLRKGKAAGREAGALHWGGIAPWQRVIAQPIYSAVGNPFSFPANVAYAIEHDVDVKRFELTVGDYVWNPPLDKLKDGSYRKHKEVWKLASRRRDLWIVGGFTPARAEEKRDVRTARSARATALIPLLLPDRHRFRWPVATLRSAPASTEPVNPATPVSPVTPVRILWNGDVVATLDLPAGGQWVEATWDAEVHVGTNELTIEAPPGAVRVSNLIVGFPPDPGPID
jgi:hypothetical protein